MKLIRPNRGIQQVLNSCFYNEPDSKAAVLGSHLFKILVLGSFVPCPRNRTDIWFPVCAGSLHEHTVWEAFTDLIMIEIMHLVYTRQCPKRLRATSQSPWLMWL